MKMILKNLCVLVFALIASSSFAKVLSLYDLPKSGAKPIGSIDLTKGVTVIFAPKGSDYVKVADPSNGNVGWVKHDALKNAGEVTFTHSFVQDSQGSHSYQVMEYGVKPQPQQQKQLTEEQAKQLKAIQNQAQEMQNLMNKTVNDMFGVFMKLAEPYQQKPTTPTQTPTKAPNAAKPNVVPAMPLKPPAQPAAPTPPATK